MKAVGIDVGLMNWVCILDEKGKETIPKFEISNSLSGFKKLEKHIDKDSKICLEDTGSYSLPLFTYLRARGYDIIRINGKFSKSLREYMKPSMKTDLLDCEVLAKIRLVEKVVPSFIGYRSHDSSPLKRLARLYWFYCSRNRKLKQKLNSVIFCICPELSGILSETTCNTVLGILRYIDLSQKVLPDTKEVYNTLRKNNVYTHKRWVTKIWPVISTGIGLKAFQGDDLRAMIDSCFCDTKCLQKLRKQLEERLKQTPYFKLLNLAYIGPVSAATLAGEIGDVRRFPTSKKFVKYCGFHFGRDQSGQKDRSFINRSGGLIKFSLRTIILQLRIHNPKFKSFYERLKAKNKKKYAINYSLIRKCLVWLYHEMWKCHTEQNNYNTLENIKKETAIPVPGYCQLASA